MQVDDLYGLPLERFVAERGALAKALRGEGRRDEAAQVAKLRKPSAAAWAVNQLVRSRGEDVDSLWEAGDALRAAQSDLLGGRGDARTLRAASDAVHEAVDALLDAARGGGLGEEELGSATLERVGETLHAAALDEDARAAVAGGRLERELRHVGLGLGLGEGAHVFAAAPAPASSPASAKAATAKKGSKREGADKAGAKRDGAGKAAAAERMAVEKAARAERDAARKKARTEAAEAGRREERAAAALRAAEERRARAAAALKEADEALEAARARAAQTAEEHRRAREAFEEL